MEYSTFVTKATAKHDGKYQYVKENDAGLRQREKILILCPEHGPFRQALADHLCGCKCPKCSGVRRYTTDDIKKRILGKYPQLDVSSIDWKGVWKKVTIVCPQHGPFEKLGDTIINKATFGCPKCPEATHVKEIDPDFVAKWQKKTKYKILEASGTARHNARFTLLCDRGHQWTAKTSTIGLGRGCAKCTVLDAVVVPHKVGDDGRMSVHDRESFIARAREVHGDVYDYSSTVYNGCRGKMEIVCKMHGPFQQTATNHTHPLKWGCPQCSKLAVTCAVVEIIDFLKSLGVKQVWFNNRSVLNPLELDLWLPEFNLGIEYHGLYWHSISDSKKAHTKKALAAANAGITLVQFFEDEWMNNPEVVKSILTHKLGKSTKLQARKCSLKEISYHEGSSFFTVNHMKGKDCSGWYGGLLLGDELVACGSFTKSGNIAHLQRFATKSGVSVAGGLSRIIRFFLSNNPTIKTVETYADKMYSTGVGYEAAGFIKTGETKPGYYYAKGRKRVSRQSMQAKNLRKQGLTGTELEMASKLGFRRIYNVGHLTYVLHAPVLM